MSASSISHLRIRAPSILHPGQEPLLLPPSRYAAGIGLFQRYIQPQEREMKLGAWKIAKNASTAETTPKLSLFTIGALTGYLMGKYNGGS